MNLNPGTKRYILRNYTKKTEKEFMQEVLIPLFDNMGFKCCRYTHGPDEIGKDFILRKQNDFGNDEFTAVIAKNGDISNTHKKKKDTIDEIRRQINQALKNPLDDFGFKGQNPSKAIVVTSGQISNLARKEISNNPDYASEKITFIESDSLINLLDKHYPNFFLFKMPIVAQYLSDLLDYIKSMTSIDSQFSSYIDSLNLYCKKDLESSEKFSSSKKEPENIFSRGHNYWMQGGTGSGKTHTIYKLAEKSLKLLENKTGKQMEIEREKFIVPVYVRARDIQSSNEGNHFSEFLLNLVKKYAQSISLDDINKWLEEYHLLLVIDEFEQKPDQKIIDIIIGYKKENPSLSIVFLSREIEKSGFKFDVPIEVWRLLDLNLNGVKNALKAVIPKNNTKTLKIYNDLLKEDILKKIPRTPLAINALSHVFSEKILKTPHNIWEFFDLFFQLVLGRWETDRILDKPLDYDQVRHFLEIVALEMVKQGVRTIPVMLLIPYAEKVLESIEDNQLKPLDFIKKIVDFGEVATIRNNEFLFKQKTFQEFLAGCEYANHHWDEGDVINKLIDLNWEDCLIFAAGQKKRDSKLLSSVNAIPETNLNHLFLKMKNIALLVQALYQTDRKKKKEALNTGLQTAITLRNNPSFINGMQTLFNTKDEIFLSLFSLSLFSSFYGRSSLSLMLQEIFKNESSNRKKAYLFCSFIEELLEHSSPEEIEEIKNLFPKSLSDSEVIAIAPYLEIEKNRFNVGRIKDLMKDKNMKKFIKKAREYISKSIISKKSKYIK